MNHTASIVSWAIAVAQTKVETRITAKRDCVKRDCVKRDWHVSLLVETRIVECADFCCYKPRSAYSTARRAGHDASAVTGTSRCSWDSGGVNDNGARPCRSHLRGLTTKRDRHATTRLICRPAASTRIGGRAGHDIIPIRLTIIDHLWQFITAVLEAERGFKQMFALDGKCLCALFGLGQNRVERH